MGLETRKGDADNTGKGLQGQIVCEWRDEGRNGECALGLIVGDASLMALMLI